MPKDNLIQDFICLRRNLALTCAFGLHLVWGDLAVRSLTALARKQRFPMLLLQLPQMSCGFLFCVSPQLAGRADSGQEFIIDQVSILCRSKLLTICDESRREKQKRQQKPRLCEA